jgi:hypothetical protein
MPANSGAGTLGAVVTAATAALFAATTLVTALRVGADTVETPAASSPWRGWSTLRLKAKAAPLLRGHVELRVSHEPGALRLETSTLARFVGATIARSETTTLLDPLTGQTREYRSHSKKKGRRYRFHEGGYHVEKLKPVKGPDGGESWSVSWSHEYKNPAPEAGHAAPPLFDYYGMLLHLRRLELRTIGDEATVHVATSGGPKAFRVTVSEARDTEREFTDLKTDQPRTLAIRELRLTITPADPAATEGFLDMEGEIEVWVEAETKTLLEVVGKIPKVPGKVRLVLSEMG